MNTPSTRPVRLADFTGQPSLRTELEVVLAGAASRDELPPHLLFAGPPGLGKTTLACIIAAELDLPLVATSGPAIERPGDMAGILIGMAGPSVVFIDEIHRMPKAAEEVLYTAMEDGRVDVVIPEGPGRTRTLQMPLPPFVLAAATTRAGMLTAPLRARFGYTGRLEPYDHATLTAIVARAANLLGSPLTEGAAALIAARSRGTPRLANHRLARVRDVAGATGAPVIDEELAAQAMDLFGIDAAGLDKTDRAILTKLAVDHRGGPVGLATLAAAVGEVPETLEQGHEPYLMERGLLDRTPRGRCATAATYTHLGLEVPAHLQGPATLPLA